MKTPAAILVAQKQPLELDEVEIPALRYGQVLVEIGATRICGSQLGEIDGVKGPDRYLPHLLGHEAGVTILEAGPGVTRVKQGDRAVLHWRAGLGLEGGGSVYTRNGATVNAGNITTFQKYAVVSENRLTVVPGDTDFEVCALLADTLTTGFGVITNNARLAIGESVVIVGCGGIGLGVVLGAKLAGAHPIIAVDLQDHKLAKAKEFGATHTINSATTDFEAAAREILGGTADVVVDGTGLPSVIEKAYTLTGPRGRCVIFGVMQHERRISINTLPLHFGKVLTGSHGGESEPAVDIPRYIRMMRDGRFDPRGFISHRMGLESINDGIARMRSGEVIHCIVHP
ncbi:dehydrogenase [Verrucomicrobia bacterium LW23]|nr:dehydrogenase [Verrucomicrobia bacterium LW23]